MVTGSYRELARRVKDFRARTGGDYAAIWISQDKFDLFPQGVRETVSRYRRGRDSGIDIEGVPVMLLEVLAPDARRGQSGHL